MDLTINTTMMAVTGASSTPPRAKPVASEEESAFFDQSAALNAALNDSPGVRPDAVERGKSVLSIPNYPPPVIQDKIARLLAVALAEETPSEDQS